MSDNKENPYIIYIRGLNRSKVEWSDNAPCNPPVGKKPDMYPASAKQQKIVATSVCANCPVQLKCLYFAIVNIEVHGVWGGFTEAERKDIVKSLSTTAADGWQDEWDEDKAKVIAGIVKTHVISHRKRYVQKDMVQAQA